MNRKEKHKVGIAERKVFTSGQSLALTLPKGFVESHGIKKGDAVTIAYNSYALIEPKKRKEEGEILREMRQKRKRMLQRGKEKRGRADTLPRLQFGARQ